MNDDNNDLLCRFLVCSSICDDIKLKKIGLKKLVNLLKIR